VPEVALGRDLDSLGWTCDEHAARLHAACRRALLSRQAVRQDDLQFSDQHGCAFAVSCVITPVLQGGQVNGLVLVFRDVAGLHHANGGLDRARDDAEATKWTRAELLADMSHEVRTPLNGVIGMSGLLLDTPLDATQREYVNTIRSCAEGVASILGDILDLSAIEAGRLTLECGPFDVPAAVEDAVAAVAGGAHQRGLEVLCEVAHDIPRVAFGDAGRFRQILASLLSHAVRHTERGEVAVSVHLDGLPGGAGARQDSPSAGQGPVRLRVEVSDTGVGIAADALSRLFDPGAPADASARWRTGGSRLGLAVCRKLVELMHGDLLVRSQPGLGTTFVVELPLQAERAPARPPDHTYLPAAARVLCVDDNSRQRRLLAGLVGALGLRCATAPHAVAAFDLLRDAQRAGDPFAAVLVDRDMPGVSGLDLTRLIRAEAALSSTAVLLVTPFGERMGAEELAALGVAGWLSKPARRAVLAEALGGALGWIDPMVAAGRRRDQIFQEPPGRRRRVLVAEDDLVNQRVILAQLRRLGIEASLARDGIEAVAAASAGDFDLVLMDCQMPEMDGFEATRAIRRLANGASTVPIVALTASALPSDREACLAAGMNAHLTKPIDHERLADALSQWLPRSSAA
jgi:signal transduction histidine kinase/CheY-like chemotaxis protein